MQNEEEKTPKSLGFYMPPEWAKQEAVWLSWPKNTITWPDRVAKVEKFYLQLIEVISSYQKVNLLVDDLKHEEEVRAKLAIAKVSFENLFFFHIPTADAWIRDYGPTFVIKDNKLGMVDWIFNAWGNKYEKLNADTGIPKKINESLKAFYFNPGIVLEGGSIEVDGEGTVLVTEQCLLNKNRNPSLSREKIEEILCEYLNASKVLWLISGVEGDDTDGHIDDITRFVAPSVVVTCFEENSSDSNYLPLLGNFKRLSSMADAKNRPLSLIKLPMPNKILADGKKALPASYANFLITNKAVLVPIFGQKNDKKALSILKEVFPTRDVLGLDCSDVIWGNGAIHCLSQQQPAIPQ